MSPESSASPLPSSSKQSRPAPSEDGDNQPPRKRSRTEMSAEERKEARAHRNRIAAQNSRDRRKAQFAALEQRIAELEAENRTLRASMGLAALRDSDELRAVESARERENAELRERVKTLESGWDAIVKAIKLQSIPLGALASASSSSSSSPAGQPLQQQATPTPPSAPSTTSTFPVIVPPSPVFPLSPTPSIESSTSPVNFFEEPESTRHLARVATTAPGELDTLLLETGSCGVDATAPAPPEPSLDDATMDDFFREILASPPLCAAPLASGPADAAAPAVSVSEALFREGTAGGVGLGFGDAAMDAAHEEDAHDEAEMQALWEWLPAVSGSDAQGALDVLSALELDIGAGPSPWVDLPPAQIAPEVF
ncbi:hypothetical protein K488DRAFT_78609 [Vararia minispora EC-137]|uniref:Uncharacterized protein n=1 Tax=Vararia minispora EC-137 TaxID=1314806 RepID=A0ACB8QLP0_9AGAM|nr:hypothetical protein K488DRAFT_78609 [Vararia minispora EC-137]